MTVKKTDNGNWLADIRPNGGSGKRYRKHFDSKVDASRREAWIKTN